MRNITRNHPSHRPHDGGLKITMVEGHAKWLNSVEGEWFVADR